MYKPKYTNEQFKVIADECKKDVLAIMQKTGLSQASVYRLLKELAVWEASLVKVQTPVAENKPAEVKLEAKNEAQNETKAPAGNTGFDVKKLVPVKNYQYDNRPYDDSLEFWSWKLNKPVCLVGEAGSGKTFSCKELARKHEVPFLLVPCEDGGSSLREQLGFWQVVAGNMEWKDGILAEVLKHPCVILFDEVNALPAGKLFMLHELLENRKLFLKDAPSDKAVLQVHPEARLLLAMNPAGNKYSGTSKLNVALANRMAIIEVPDWKTEELKITCKDSEKIKKFYDEAKNVIKAQELRVAISRRNLERIAVAINNGATLKNAILEGFINSALLTASSEEKAGLWNLAIAVFGIEALEPTTEVKGEDNV